MVETVRKHAGTPGDEDEGFHYTDQFMYRVMSNKVGKLSESNSSFSDERILAQNWLSKQDRLSDR